MSGTHSMLNKLHGSKIIWWLNLFHGLLCMYVTQYLIIKFFTCLSYVLKIDFDFQIMLQWQSTNIQFIMQEKAGPSLEISVLVFSTWLWQTSTLLNRNSQQCEIMRNIGLDYTDKVKDISIWHFCLWVEWLDKLS